MTDLAQVAQRRYNVAMAMVMGKDMDSVIVDTDTTAKQCVEYLKEQQVPPMTFIPLSTIVAKPVNDRLRALGGSTKLALDLLTYPPALERAFLSICGYASALCILSSSLSNRNLQNIFLMLCQLYSQSSRC